MGELGRTEDERIVSKKRIAGKREKRVRMKERRVRRRKRRKHEESRRGRKREGSP